MNSVKVGIVVVVALAVGALGGGVFARQQLGSHLTQMAQERDAVAEKLKETNKQLGDLMQLAKSNEAALAARTSELQQVQAASDSAANAPVAVAAPVEPAATEAVPPPGPGLGKRGDPDPMAGVPRDANGNPLPPEPPQTENPAARADFTQRMNDRMQTFYEAEAAKTTDPAVQQRLATLRDQSTYMLDVMARMRDTTDPNERAQLQEEFQQVRTTVTTLSQEQQDYMLRQVAIQGGVTDPQKQEAMMNSLREAQASPLFRSPMLSWGGGPGMGRNR